MNQQTRAPRNRTIVLTDEERELYSEKLVELSELKTDLKNVTICQDSFDAVQYIQHGSVDLLILDPPYNIDKTFDDYKFSRLNDGEYEGYISDILEETIPLLKPTATVYICADWHSSSLVYNVARDVLRIRNRITWEREKGRGSQRNWKNNLEDIWFCTVSDKFTFNADAVKIKKKVIAPYKTDGNPKDWMSDENGKFRLTHHSNVWTDITVPFWSMPENTDHPTQKSEKLIAKLLLASSNPGDLILDPFLGSGTTSVVAKKLGRNYIGIDRSEEFCMLAEKRLALVDANQSIQGFKNDVFHARNMR